jgi:hypothetical protein
VKPGGQGICEHGNLQFHLSVITEVRQSSEMCPD